MDTANADLSERLYEVLDFIGASEYVRKKYWEFAMLHEIIFTFATRSYDQAYHKITFYHVGSTCEGTTTPGLDSDIDMIYCEEDMHVVENIVDAKQQGISYLILTDEFTKPGYVRLQKVKDKCPLSIRKCDVSENSLLKIDRNGKICITHLQIIDGLNNTRNGPADTVLARMGVYQQDRVCALRFRQIQRLDNSWLHRTRKYDWPSQKQLWTMGSYGCFLVGVGHPHSDYKSIEWRFSFSLQERDLMLSLNATQHKCYILLKMIKKDIIVSKAGESISSYHCKTSLFYTIENSHRHCWMDSNLILYARLCLIRILNWVKAKHCPNYFIPEENMFDKLSPITLKTIENILIDIIDSGVNFLYTLTCDNLGALLKSKTSGSELLHSLDNTNTTRQPRLLVCNIITMMIYRVRNIFLRQLNLMYDTHTDYVNGAMQMLLYLQNTNHVTEHTTREVRMAFDSIIPHIQLQHEQSLFSQYLSRVDLSRLRFKTFPKVISESSSEYDLISSKLALASLYIQFEQLQEECQCILVLCENSLKTYVESMCACLEFGTYSNPALAEKLRLTDMSSKYFERHCTTGCMVFHLSQVALLCKALQYELFRSVYTKPDSEIETNRYNWLNWVTIDSKIYLYFLQYLLYSKKQTMTEKDTAVRKLKKVLETDPNLGHRETALNLFGLICLQENVVPGAWRLFCLSWKFRPFRNAAKWHMLILLSGVIKGK